MNENKPRVHIGAIGRSDHNKRTLLEAVKKVLASENINLNDEYQYKCEIKVNSGGNEMTKGIKNYVGSTILGYRFVLDRNTSRKNKYTKGNSKIKNNTLHNKVKVLNKRRDYSN